MTLTVINIPAILTISTMNKITINTLQTAIILFYKGKPSHASRANPPTRRVASLVHPFLRDYRLQPQIHDSVPLLQ